MKNSIEEREVLQFLSEIEEGKIILTPTVEPQDVYAGNVEYLASNGWKIIVFNDCNQWDYIESIEISAERIVDFSDLEKMPGIQKYRPSKEISWSRYKIPGYLNFRCTKCGKDIKGRKDEIYLCEDCQKK